MSRDFITKAAAPEWELVIDAAPTNRFTPAELARLQGFELPGADRVISESPPCSLRLLPARGKA